MCNETATSEAGRCFEEQVENMKEYLVYSILDVVRRRMATTAGTDIAPDYRYAQLATQMQSGHWAFEVGLKTLIENSQGEYKRTHDLPKLYSKLRGVNPQAFDDLDKVYRDTVNFYRLNDLEEDLSGYLARVGKEKVFERLRYAALDQPAVAFRDVPLSEVYFELLAVLKDYEKLGLRPFHLPSLRIDQQVVDVLTGAMTSAPDEFERRKDAWTWLCNKVKSDSMAWRDLLLHARRRDFRLEEAQSDRVEVLLRGAYETLTGREQNSDVHVDPALNYYLRRIAYVPRGSEQTRGTPRPSLSDESDDVTFGQISSPSGKYLGSVSKLPDGAWVVDPPNAQRLTFEMKGDAVLYVARAQTRILRVHLGEGKRQDVRIVHDKDYIEWPTVAVGDDWQPPAGPDDATLVFWDECPFEVGDSLEAALLPFDDDFRSVLRIKAKVHSRTEQSCVIRGDWVVDVRKDTD